MSNKDLAFRLKIINDVPVSKRCPYLELDDGGIRCDTFQRTDEKRGMVVDHISLQLWCTAEYRRCIHYRDVPDRI